RSRRERRRRCAHLDEASPAQPLWLIPFLLLAPIRVHANFLAMKSISPKNLPGRNKKETVQFRSVTEVLVERRLRTVSRRELPRSCRATSLPSRSISRPTG